jgi:hypothetical protein
MLGELQPGAHTKPRARLVLHQNASSSNWRPGGQRSGTAGFDHGANVSMAGCRLHPLILVAVARTSLRSHWVLDSRLQPVQIARAADANSAALCFRWGLCSRNFMSSNGGLMKEQLNSALTTFRVARQVLFYREQPTDRTSEVAAYGRRAKIAETHTRGSGSNGHPLCDSDGCDSRLRSESAGVARSPMAYLQRTANHKR